VSSSSPEKNAPAAPAELSFEEALRRLEDIVEELEGGQLTLEESLGRFEEGLRLRAECLRRLAQAETKIEQVLAETSEEAGPDIGGESIEEDGE
jgi:exodeoxyribonuclease VII small subunit